MSKFFNFEKKDNQQNNSGVPNNQGGQFFNSNMNQYQNNGQENTFVYGSIPKDQLNYNNQNNNQMMNPSMYNQGNNGMYQDSNMNYGNNEMYQDPNVMQGGYGNQMSDMSSMQSQMQQQMPNMQPQMQQNMQQPMQQQPMQQQMPNMQMPQLTEQMGEAQQPLMSAREATIAPSINRTIDDVESLDTSEVLDMPLPNNVIVDTSKDEEFRDPLNNANNPIPVNPVADVSNSLIEEEEINNKDVKTNIFSVIGMMLGMAFHPGTTIIKNAKKYRDTGKAITVTIWITIVTLLLCVATRVVVGSFVRTYSPTTGFPDLRFDISNIFRLDNYLEFLVLAFLMSFVLIMIVSLTYYSSSFLNSKGINLGSYVMVSNLSMLPLILGVVVLAPIGSIVTPYLGLLIIIFSGLYTITTFLIGIDEILTFSSIDRKIMYNVFDISLVMIILCIIISVLVKFNIVIIPDLHI